MRLGLETWFGPVIGWMDCKKNKIWLTVKAKGVFVVVGTGASAATCLYFANTMQHNTQNAVKYMGRTS